MTDSMKFGPEWLRNMSNDMSNNTTGSSGSGSSGGGLGGGGGGSIGGGSSGIITAGSSSLSTSSSSLTATLGIQSSTAGGQSSTSQSSAPRYQLAEYRYGREEMLSLFDKNLKLPEILPNFKNLFVEKVQCPLALTPSTEDEIVNSTRPWVIRSPVSFGGVPIRGTGRGGSVDRGRGRPRGVYHTSLSFQRPTALYDEDIRGIGRGERGWPERNGANEIGSSIDWNGSPSSSPRKEYSSHGRGSNIENWRRNRTEEDAGDGWRGINNTNSSSGAYRWTRSTSWRDEDIGGVNGGETSSISAMTRSFSTSGGGGTTTSSSMLDHRGGGSLSSIGMGYKLNSHSGGSGNHHNSNDMNLSKTNNTQWDQDDMLPEWAMENPTDGGGSFDATGAFHGPNDDCNDDDHLDHGHNSNKNRTSSSSPSLHKDDINHKDDNELSDQNSKKDEENNIGINNNNDNSNNGKNNSHDSNRKSSELISNNSNKNDKVNEGDKDQSDKLNDNDCMPLNKNQHKTSGENKLNNTIKLNKTRDIKSDQHELLSSSPLSQQENNNNKNNTNKHSPIISEISDRMQEVADDMVEKLIMDDELLTPSTNLSLSSSSSASSSSSSSVAVQGVVGLSSSSTTSTINKSGSLNTSSSSNITTPSSTILSVQQQQQPQQPQQPQQQQQQQQQQQKVPILKNSNSNSIASNPPITTATLLQPPQQQPLVNVNNNHPLISQSSSQLHHSHNHAHQSTSVPLPQSQPQPIGEITTSDLWYYRDPQGKVQGPFTAAEMVEWYRAGYFDENLYVRRVCDSRYAALGELVKMCGNSMPFLSSHLIPPLLSVDMTTSNMPITIQQQQQHVQQKPTSIGGNGGVGIGSIPVQQQQQQQQLNQKSNVNISPFLNQNDMISLNSQLQFLQKQFLMRQQSMILSKLATTEAWSVLNAEQQQRLLLQQMSQVVLPEHLMSLSALSNSLSMVNSSYALQQGLMAAKNEIQNNNNKPTSTTSSNQNLLTGNSGNGGSGGGGIVGPFGNIVHNDFTTGPSQLHNLLQNSQQQPSHHHIGPTIDNDPIKSLLIQLQMQKGMQTGSTPPSMGGTSASGGPPSGLIAGISAVNKWPNSLQQHPSSWGVPPPSSSGPLATNVSGSQVIGIGAGGIGGGGGNSGGVMLGGQSGIGGVGHQQQQQSSRPPQPVTMWDFRPPEMKTEQQIIEEQIQNEKLTRQQNDLIKSLTNVGNVSADIKQQHQSDVIDQLQQQSSQQQLLQQSQQQQHQQQQSTITTTTTNMTSKKDHHHQPQHEKSSGKNSSNDEKPSKSHQKHDGGGQFEEVKVKGGNKNKSDKKDNSQSVKKLQQQQQQTDEERKKDAAEERKRQKEEKKRLQLDEEKKRAEDEKRRQIMEEKKRREEIDQHRRAKMLENSVNNNNDALTTTSSSSKLGKQQQAYENTNGSNGGSGRQSMLHISSIAPWSNSVLPGIQSPGPNFAEIQKAERERRAEEQRLEQILEHQRKNQQIEMMLQQDKALKWNAKPLKTINVKSLAEIQAEEAKRQQANELAAATAVCSIEQQQQQQGRRKDDIDGINLIGNNTLGSVIQHQQQAHLQQSQQQSHQSTSIYPNNRFAAIWNNRSSQNVVWNGAKAWNTTPTTGGGGSSVSGFWEEPTKISSLSSTATSASLISNQPQTVKGTTLTMAAAAAGAAASSISSTAINSIGGGNPGSTGSGAGGGGSRLLTKSQTVSNMQTIKNTNSSTTLSSAISSGAASSSGGNKQHGLTNSSTASSINNNKGPKDIGGNGSKNNKKNTGTNPSGGSGGTNNANSNNSISGNTKKDDARNEFTSWCIKTLSSMNSIVDVPTYVAFLQDLESPYEVKDYIRMYLGETKECSEFGKQFLERRSKYKNQQRAQNAHIDDMCMPAPAINPSSNDFQEVKGKAKKVKKNKMTKLDARILGFSVTAAQDRINVGDRDYGDAS